MSLIATTELGCLRGVRHRAVVQFRGVPYARPPARFEPPGPPQPWVGLLDATVHGPVAPQGPSRLRGAVGDVDRAQSEDCLTLTITTPAVDDRRRPVVVWLHGGGYGSGAGSLDWYDGAELARAGDVVVVGVNYRLGPLGYLAHDGLADGRAGLHDMIAAIRWVTGHIGAFGGDPGAITLMGQSAGAHSILCMLTMPEVRTLFRRVILQSAPAGIAPLAATEAAGWTRRYVDVLGLGGLPDGQVRRQLRSVEPAGLLRAAATLARDTAHLGQVAPPFLPVVDELADVDRFLSAAAQGAAEAGVAVVVGTNRDEARAVVAADPAAMTATSAAVEAYLREALDDERARSLCRRLAAGERPADVLADAMTETVFTGPSLRFAAQAAHAGAQVWAYRLDWAPAGSALGACHCLELPLVFDTGAAWTDAPMLGGPTCDTADRDRVGAAMRAAWLSVARHGRPDHELPWPTHNPHDPHTMIFGPSAP